MMGMSEFWNCLFIWHLYIKSTHRNLTTVRGAGQVMGNRTG